MKPSWGGFAGHQGASTSVFLVPTSVGRCIVAGFPLLEHFGDFDLMLTLVRLVKLVPVPELRSFLFKLCRCVA